VEGVAESSPQKAIDEIAGRLEEGYRHCGTVLYQQRFQVISNHLVAGARRFASLAKRRPDAGFEPKPSRVFYEVARMNA
jgi:hypothetical protein